MTRCTSRARSICHTSTTWRWATSTSTRCCTTPRRRCGAAAAAIQRAAPLDALSMYLDCQKVEADRRELLLRYARELAADSSIDGTPTDPRPLIPDPASAAST